MGSRGLCQVFRVSKPSPTNPGSPNGILDPKKTFISFQTPILKNPSALNFQMPLNLT